MAIALMGMVITLAEMAITFVGIAITLVEMAITLTGIAISLVEIAITLTGIAITLAEMAITFVGIAISLAEMTIIISKKCVFATPFLDFLIDFQLFTASTVVNGSCLFIFSALTIHHSPFAALWR